MVRNPTIRSEIFPIIPNHEPRHSTRVPRTIVEEQVLQEPLRASPEVSHSLRHYIDEDDPTTIAAVAEFMKNRKNSQRVMEYLGESTASPLPCRRRSPSPGWAAPGRKSV